MTRSTFAAPTSPRGARRSLRWLVAGLMLPLGLLGIGLARAGTSPAPDLPWPPAAESPIRPGESHSWSFDMAAGDFLDVVVEQKGIDVVIELYDRGTGGTKVLDADSPEDWFWEEETAWVAERSGRYRLVVYPWNDHAAPGSYRIRIDGPRPARPGDGARVEATREMRAAAADFNEKSRLPARLEHLERALRLWRELGERRRQAETLHQMGAAAFELGRMEEASSHLHRALDLWDQLGLPDRRAWTLLQAGKTDQALLREEDARNHMEEALQIARRVDDRLLLLHALYEAGHFFEPHAAVQYLEDALQIAARLPEPHLELLSLYRLGFVYDDLGEKQDALRYYEKARDLAHQRLEVGIEANALNGLGLVYASLGQTEKAIGLYGQALKLYRLGKDTGQETAALNNLAVIYERLDPARARDLYEQTLVLGRESLSKEAQAAALSNLAFLEIRVGDPARALELCDQALALGVKRFEIPSLQARGMAWRRLKDLDASQRELRAALDLSRRRQDRIRESLVILELARTVQRQGDLHGTLDLLKSGIEIVESLRTKVAEEDLRATFLASRQDIYSLYTDTLMALDRAEPGRGYDAEALRTSEQARARSLLDILAEAGADVLEGADPGLLERERRLRADIAALEKRRLELFETGSGLREATERLTALLDEYGKIEADLRVSSPRYAALTQPEPLSVDRIRSQVLDGRALLLEYALGEERSFLWAVSPDGLESFELPARAVIEDAARRYYAALRIHPNMPSLPEGKDAGPRLKKAADELSAMLLGPAKDLLAGRPLLVVSDGALQYVPFAPLPTPASLGRRERVPLIAEHEIVSLPSASALAVLRRQLAGRPTPPKVLAVLADPVFQKSDARLTRRPTTTAAGPPRRGTDDFRAGEIDPRKLPRLTFSGKEAEAIISLVPAGKWFKALGFQASRATATGGELAHYSMVHFATHGLIDSRHPELSSLVLSLVDEKGRPQNGFLRLHDIYNLELNADLVVLSACQTALGQEIRGEGLVGLTRGFMYAGAARVMSSLWSVDDRATAELMERFYRHMISGRLSAAEALRRTQVEMSRMPRWSSPYYWAGFSLQGEWR
jgi:CHAT domain-containing protein/Flp pilus assembly protein TadD